jgi:hypothetical protein
VHRYLGQHGLKEIALKLNPRPNRNPKALLQQKPSCSQQTTIVCAAAAPAPLLAD